MEVGIFRLVEGCSRAEREREQKLTSPPPPSLLSSLVCTTRNLPLHPQSLHQLCYNHHLPRSLFHFPSQWNDRTQPVRSSNGDRLGGHHLDLPSSPHPHKQVRPPSHPPFQFSSLSLSLSSPTQSTQNLTLFVPPPPPRVFTSSFAEQSQPLTSSPPIFAPSESPSQPSSHLTKERNLGSCTSRLDCSLQRQLTASGPCFSCGSLGA